MAETLSYLVPFGPLVMGFLLILLLPLGLRGYQGIYLALGVVTLGLWTAALLPTSPLVILGGILGGEALHLLAIAAWDLSARDYAALLMVGLFPWYLGASVATLFTLLLLLTMSAWGFVHLLRSAQGHSLSDLRRRGPEVLFTPDELAVYYAKGTFFMAAPFLCATLLTAGIVVLL